MHLSPFRRDVLAALPQHPAIQTRLREVAEQIRADAARRAPRNTGRLRRSLQVEAVRGESGQKSYRVGWNKHIAFYGPLVESGTKYTRAQPHLRPAAERFTSDSPGRNSSG